MHYEITGLNIALSTGPSNSGTNYLQRHQ